VRYGFADQRVGGWHVLHILGRVRNQVNGEGQLVGQVPINAFTGHVDSTCPVIRLIRSYPEDDPALHKN
jgi:hypothetical protein